MVDEAWSVNDVEEFCVKYELKCNIKYKETTEYPEGTLISQTRSPKSPIAKGASFGVTFAKAPTVSEDKSDNVTPDVSEQDSNQ